jgi:hypothetical protein
LQQLETAVSQGHFPARWMPDANYGYGYPFYNFYAPLSIYIAALFRLFGFSYVRAIQLAQVAGFIAAAWGMFALARRWLGSHWAALLAAAAYTTAPFHMVNVYVRGDSLAEFWAMAFYPLALLAADWLLERPSRRTIALFALAYSALILSHNISALIFTPFLLLYILLKRLWSQNAATARHNSSLITHHSSLLWSGAGLLLALALASWFFIPALAEKSLAQLEPVTAGYFHFSNHFRSGDLVQPSLLFDYGVDGGNAFRMGLAQAVTAVSGLLILLFWRKNGVVSRPVSWFILLSFAIATFMITPLSRWLWENLPLLSFTQFPWRFLSVQAFAGGLAAGGLALLPGRKWLVPGVAALLVAAALGNLHTDHLRLSDADVTARKLAEYEWYTGNIGSTVSAEYLPPWVLPRPVTSPWLNSGERNRVTALAGEAAVQLETRRAARQTWSVTAGDEGAVLLFPTMYWPGWGAEIDGETAVLEAAPGSGLMMVRTPPGTHVVELRLARTPLRLAAELVSLTAVFLTIWLLRPRRWRLPPRRWLLAGAGSLLLLLLLARWPQPDLPAADLNWDFARMAYLNHAGSGVPYANETRLERYEYSAETLAPGETLTIEMAWSGEGLAENPAAAVALYSPAITRPPILAEVEPPPLAQEMIVLAAQTAVSLQIPADAPPGLYIPRLVVDGADPLTPSGQGRGALFLRPVQVLAADEDGSSGRELDVAVDTAVFREDGTLDLHLAWWTARPLSANYNLSLRLLDANGQWLRQLDTQPGFGFLPSSGWRPGRWTADWLALRLPDLPPAAGPFPLLVQLYDVGSPETAVLTRRLGVVAWDGARLVFRENEPVFALPEGVGGETAVFGEQIRLLGSSVTQTAEAVTVTLVWQALADGQRDYTRFLHLLPPEGGPPVAQEDSYPRQNSYPTGQWTAGEVVAEALSLPLAGLPPGEYRLAVGFYEVLADGSVERITAVGDGERPLPDNALVFGRLKIED